MFQNLPNLPYRYLSVAMSVLVWIIIVVALAAEWRKDGGTKLGLFTYKIRDSSAQGCSMSGHYASTSCNDLKCGGQSFYTSYANACKGLKAAGAFGIIACFISMGVIAMHVLELMNKFKNTLIMYILFGVEGFLMFLTMCIGAAGGNKAPSGSPGNGLGAGVVAWLLLIPINAFFYWASEKTGGSAPATTK